MKTKDKIVGVICIMALFLAPFATGCATQGQTGAAVGAGAGALIGGLANMHGSWAATALIGAGVGAGVGYLIGNEEDKKDAQRRQAVRTDELRPLSGTTWQVISVTPKQERHLRSTIVHFRHDGTVVTTKTHQDGRTETATEGYRIVGSTLIIYKSDYVVNEKFSMEGNKLYIDYGNGSVVLQRVS